MRDSCEKLVVIGDWCITKDSAWGESPGIYADHITGCLNGGDGPIDVGDCCWAHDDDGVQSVNARLDGVAQCFYCRGAVPPEIQALVLLQMKL